MSAGPTGNDQRRRVTRTRICSGWNGVGVLTQNLPDNTGLAQHQIYLACTSVPSAGTAEVWVRPAKMAYFVPVGTIDLSVSGSGQILLPAVIDGVELTFPTALSGGTIKAGILSIADDFTTSHDQSDVDRRRFGNAVFSPGWTGAAPISSLCEEQSGFSQHQISMAGGTGTVRLMGRPTSAEQFVDVGLPVLNAAGELKLFSGMYDAYMLMPVGAVTGNINAQVISVGEEMFFPYTFAQIEAPPRTLAGYGITDAVPMSRTISTTTPLTGGGDLSANLTLAIPAATASVAGYMTAAYASKLGGIATGATAYTDANARAAVVIDSIADADTTHAPSRNAVFDSLVLKVDSTPGYLAGADANVTPGVWAGSVAAPSTNTPAGSWTDLLAFGTATTYRTQIARGWFSSTLYTRAKLAGAWAGWNNIWDSANFDPVLKADKTITISTTAPLTGGGNLSANLTLAIPAATASVAGHMTAAYASKLDGVATGATAYTDANAQAAVVIDSIADGDITHAPSRNTVFDALALKADLSGPDFTGPVSSTGTVSTGGYTVATLPAGTIGMRAYVTDALAPSFGAALVGGGAVVTPAFYNGTTWIDG